jgi:hypothetical protein
VAEATESRENDPLHGPSSEAQLRPSIWICEVNVPENDLGHRFYFEAAHPPSFAVNFQQQVGAN